MDVGMALILIVVMGIAVFVMSKVSLGPKVRCTRCNGSGQIDEKWPDPSKPGGWHRAEGTCPKCKGKGTVSGR